jgi:peroxiredoxin
LLKEAGFELEDVHMPILADPAHTVSATYGVAFQMQIHTEWSNRPASFVIDHQGIIRFAHRAKSYSDRPTPEALLKELAKLKGN